MERPAGGGRARVMVRPEQIRLDEPANGGVAATVQSYEYYGHDAVVRVRPEADGLPDLVVRVTGGVPLEPGHRVGLSRARRRRGLAAGAGGAGEDPPNNAFVTTAVSSGVH